MKLIILILLVISFSGCTTRALTTGEDLRLKDSFQTYYDSKATVIKKESVTHNQDFQKALSDLNISLKQYQNQKELISRPFVINNVIYYPPSLYLDDFSKSIYLDDWALFVHENCHVFAKQVGLRSKKHHNKKYNWTLGLQEQISPGPSVVYKIEPSDIKPTSELSDFYFEQQCEIFKYWAMYKELPEYQVYGELIFKALDDISFNENTLLEQPTPTNLQQSKKQYVFSKKEVIDSRFPFSILKEKIRQTLNNYKYRKCSSNNEIYFERSSLADKHYIARVKVITRNYVPQWGACGMARGGIKTQVEISYLKDNKYELSIKIKEKEPIYMGVNFYKRNETYEKQLYEHLKNALSNDIKKNQTL